jgi:hypothetical protein
MGTIDQAQSTTRATVQSKHRHMNGRHPSMESTLTSVLTVLAIAITTVVAAYLFTGPGYAIELTVVSLLALGAWLRFSLHQAPSQDAIVAPYTLVIVLSLLLNTSRYWSGYASFLTTHWPSFFAPNFSLTHVSWFVLFVTLPVSVMLLGGYYLSKRLPLGFYMAWWAFLYGVAEALLHYKVEFGSGGSYSHRYFVGSLAAIALVIVGVTGCQRLLQKHAPVGASNLQPAALTNRQVNLWTTLFVCLVVIYGVTLYSQAGVIPIAVVVGSMLGGLLGWRKTTARYPADPYRVVPLYLLLLCLFSIHVGEETITSFNQGITSLSGTAWSDAENTFLIALIGPAVWVFGAWSLWLRQPFGNFVLWFMTVGMILGEPTHFLVFPVVAMQKFGIGYQYFSGMYTALFPMIPAVLLLVVLVQEHKHRVAHAKG